MESIIQKLDLYDFTNTLSNLFARPKSLVLEGDINQHFLYLQELDKMEFNAPPAIKELDERLMYISKQGILGVEDIFEFVKIINYMRYLKSLPLEGKLFEWLDSIEIPAPITEILPLFDKDGEIKSDIDERLASIEHSIKKNKEQIRYKLQSILNNDKLSSYLVDRQLHYINEEEALLLRGGFNHHLRGKIVSRSSAGFFYVVPSAINELKEKHAGFIDKKEAIILEYRKKISSLFLKWLKFLKFINKAFDRFDHYQARIHFAKQQNLNFMLPTKDTRIILKDFVHPALLNPKPISLDFSKDILLITGVNAGGKTMLLKSILASAFLAKHLIPMKIDKKSHIGSFKEILSIIEDPQNVKNDISTFAGRMVQFSHLFHKNGALVGVDEIELGTDSDEAASLFKVILEELSKRRIKVVITTHHKRLASLMASFENTELVAALYDEKAGTPTYEFLQGTIGKSYAFETAKRYGIPLNIVGRVKEEYGKDQEKLSTLIERSSTLERDLTLKNRQLDEELEKIQKIKSALNDERENFAQEIKNYKHDIEKSYNEAINEAKKAIKSKTTNEAHKYLNYAHIQSQKLKEAPTPSDVKIEKGDWVKYRNKRGKVISLKAKEAFIETDGMKMRVPLSELKLSKKEPKVRKKVNVQVSKPSKMSVKLDLHGMRSDEAIELVDKFISDSLIEGRDELLIYHGIGTGKLAYAVREFLKTHPSVQSFNDAPINMGGYGATVVALWDRDFVFAVVFWAIERFIGALVDLFIVFCHRFWGGSDTATNVNAFACELFLANQEAKIF